MVFTLAPIDPLYNGIVYPSAYPLDGVFYPIDGYRRLHLSVDMRQKKSSNRVPKKTCFAAKRLNLTAVKANCCAKGKLYKCFDQRVPLIFYFSQLLCIFFAQKEHTGLHKLFFRSKNSCKE